MTTLLAESQSHKRLNLMNAAVCALLHSNNNKAHNLFQEALKCIDDEHALCDSDIGEIMVHLGNLSIQEGRIDEAIATLKLAAYVYSHCQGASADNAVLALETAAHLSRVQGKFGDWHQIQNMIAQERTKPLPQPQVSNSVHLSLAH